MGSSGLQSEWLWRALRGKGIKVQVVAIGLDFDDTIRSERALKRWSNGAGKQVDQIAEGTTQDEPDVKAEMQLIENAILKVDTVFMAKYGGVQSASKQLLAELVHIAPLCTSPRYLRKRSFVGPFPETALRRSVFTPPGVRRSRGVSWSIFSPRLQQSETK